MKSKKSILVKSVITFLFVMAFQCLGFSASYPIFKFESGSTEIHFTAKGTFLTKDQKTWTKIGSQGASLHPVNFDSQDEDLKEADTYYGTESPVAESKSIYFWIADQLFVAFENGKVIELPIRKEASNIPDIQIVSTLKIKETIYSLYFLNYNEVNSKGYSLREALIINTKGEILRLPKYQGNSIHNNYEALSYDAKKKSIEVDDGERDVATYFPNNFVANNKPAKAQVVLLSDFKPANESTKIAKKIDPADLPSALKSEINAGQKAKAGKKSSSKIDDIKYELMDLSANGAIMVPNAEGQEVDAIELIKSFTTDLTEAELENPVNLPEFDQEALTKIRLALSQPEMGNAVILGEPGVGKTTLVKAFVQELVKGHLKEFPEGIRVLALDAASLSAGTQFSGSIESKINAVIQISKKVPVIWFMDEIHSLRGAGTHSGQSNDIFQNLKTPLTEGWLRVIGTSTTEEFDSLIAGDVALAERFDRVVKGEPSPEQTVKILKAWAERFSLEAPSDKLLEYIVKLSGKFDAVGAQPRKSIRILRKLYAERAIAKMKKPISREDIEKLAMNIYGVDKSYFEDTTLLEKIRALPKTLDDQIVGHTRAKEIAGNMITQMFAGLQDPNKPPVRLIFSGPKGTGKTQLAMAIANGLSVPFVRIEMNQYAQGKTPQDLLREVSQALRKNAFSVIVFDEIEKADTASQQALLSLLDNGLFTVQEKINTTHNSPTRSVRVSARKATLIMTGNAGSNYILSFNKEDASMSHDLSDKKSATNQLNDRKNFDQNQFEQEAKADGLSELLIDRVQAVIPFFPASKNEFKGIVALQVDRLLANLKAEGKNIVLTDREELIKSLTDKYFREGSSNRQIERVLEQEVKARIAVVLLTNKESTKPVKVTIGELGACGSIISELSK